MGKAQDVTVRAVNCVYRNVLRTTKGKVGGKLLGLPTLDLVTTGRKSGQVRHSMLTAPVIDGDRIVLVASYGGSPGHPHWFLNLRDNPDVTIYFRGEERRMRARVANPDERAALWPRVTAKAKNYADYQTKTAREIPLVILEPALPADDRADGKADDQEAAGPAGDEE
jgi:deazaflavin-dependent oxidoreductase (nitroreductase family)